MSLALLLLIAISAATANTAIFESKFVSTELTTEEMLRIYDKELFRIKIVNDYDGEISFSRNHGKTFKKLGKVLTPAADLSIQKSYTASKWAKNSSVAAAAVNSIHIRTGYDADTEHAAIFSILPKEFNNINTDNYYSYLNLTSAILTDIKGGSEIFGGKFSPILSSSVFLMTDDYTAESLPEKYMPKPGDTFAIIVTKRTDNIKEIVFENKIDGRIYINTTDRKRETVIGKVTHPISGIGRFEGGIYAKQGQIRANHNGVICISASNYGDIGGFQIIPIEHSKSSEMVNDSSRPQWMVVEYIDGIETVGEFPLFYGLLSPVSNDSHITDKYWGYTSLQKSIIVNIKKNGKWEKMPKFSLNKDLSLPLQEFANSALADVEAIRIILPEIN